MHYLAFFDPAVYQPSVTIVTCDEDLNNALDYYKRFDRLHPKHVKSVKIGDDLIYEKIKIINHTTNFVHVGDIKFTNHHGGSNSIFVYAMKVSKGKPVCMALS